MRIGEAQKLVERSAEKFEGKWKAERKGTPQLYFVDIVETLGELAGIIKVKEFWRTEPEFYHANRRKKLKTDSLIFFTLSS
jgi:NADPH-dependent glutamate synthase beta subunit-like oxidoreductase